jgi:hypothetical protein
MVDENQGPALSIQTTQLIAQVVSIVGTLAAAFGILTPTQVAGITTNVMAIAGPLAALGGIIWSFVASRKTAVVSAVAAMPEVKAVVTEPTAAGVELARNGNTPNNVVVNGTAAAAGTLGTMRS